MDVVAHIGANLLAKAAVTWRLTDSTYSLSTFICLKFPPYTILCYIRPKAAALCCIHNIKRGIPHQFMIIFWDTICYKKPAAVDFLGMHADFTSECHANLLNS